MRRSSRVVAAAALAASILVVPAAEDSPGRSALPVAGLFRIADGQAAERTRTVPGALRRALDAGSIDQKSYRRWLDDYRRAREERRRLGGRCRLQLSRVLEQLERLARTGWLTASRMPILFLQLERNTEFWSAKASIAAQGRVQFPGSHVIWEHFPGQGLQFHALGTFGKLQAMANVCLGYFGDRYPCPRDELRSALDELAGLRVRRGSSFAWEYYFFYGGGSPPWVSSMSQATGLAAFAKGAQVLRDLRYLRVALDGLPLFSMRPPLGVSVPTAGGVAYLHYSFAPRTWILNAWLQTLIGLLDVATRSNDPTAWADFRDGDSALRRILPRFDTGRWSRYELGGPEASYSYQQLVVGFLAILCRETGRSGYCRYARRFDRELRARPRPPRGRPTPKRRCGVGG